MAFTTLLIFTASIALSHSKDCFKPELAVFAQFCSDGGERSVAGDFNGDGYDDLLCHNFRTGFLEIMYSSHNAFEKRYWSNSTDWCKGTDNEVIPGDYNGDGKSDLLCHNPKSGKKDVAYANNQGNFYDYDCDWIDADGRGGGEVHIGTYDPEECVKKCVQKSLRDSTFNGATYRKAGSPTCYCEKSMTYTSSSSTWRTCYIKKVKCGTFVNGDGTGGPETSEGSMSSDQACVDRCISLQKTNREILGASISTDGRHRCYCEKKMDSTTGSSSYKVCPILPKRLAASNSWCVTTDAKFYVGDFNGDGKTDWLCEKNYGKKYIQYATMFGHIGFDTDTVQVLPACDGELFVGNFNSDKKNDLLCYNYASGLIKIDLNQNNVFSGYSVSIDGQDWCKGTDVFIRVADINGDGLDDLICKNMLADGQAKVLKNEAPHYFDPTKTTYYSKFCINSKRTNFLTGPFTGDQKGDFMCLLDNGRIQVEKSHCV